MKSLEGPPSPDFPKHHNPRQDAADLYADPQLPRIQERLLASAAALQDGRFGDVSGPAFAKLDDIVDKLADLIPSDRDLITTRLQQLIQNSLDMRGGINQASQEAREAITSSLHEQGQWTDQLDKQKQAWTPFMQLLRHVSEVNALDIKGEQVTGKDFFFRRYQKSDEAPQFSNPAYAATATGAIFHILFQADHNFRPEAEAQQLLKHVQASLAPREKT